MEMILTVANAAGGIIAGFLAFAIWELLRLLTGRKVDEEVAALRRRLADVEALRSPERGNVSVEEAISAVHSTSLNADGAITISADLTPRGRHRLEELGIIPFYVELSGVTSREQAERIARRRDPCRVPPAGWDCTRAPGHDGPCAAIPAHGGYPDVQAIAKGKREAARNRAMGLGRPICDETEGDCA